MKKYPIFNFEDTSWQKIKSSWYFRMPNSENALSFITNLENSKHYGKTRIIYAMPVFKTRRKKLDIYIGMKNNDFSSKSLKVF